MSRSKDKIIKALKSKGYEPGQIIWEPIGSAAIMCGPSGGWYIEVAVAADENGERENIDVILAYNVTEALEEIERLPQYIPETAVKEGNP